MKYLLLALSLAAATVNAQIKVACVGDSITFGHAIPARDRLSYPAQLGHLLGPDYEVRNFGVSGHTMLQKGNAPYRRNGAYQRSLDFQPDIVIIKLGTNDSKPVNWPHQAEFEGDTEALIESYRALESMPRVILCLPVPVFKDSSITAKVVRREVAPQLRKVALKTGVELVDLHPVLIEHPEMFPDGLHPNAFGAQRMAEYLFRVVSMERDASFSFAKPDGSSVGSYSGFTTYNFKHQGHPCRVAVPKKVAKGAPWVWRAYYWGHQPQFDVAMLEHGWHVAYCSVANLFGSPKAVERWNGFYAFMREQGFGAKPVLEGMSRGGMIIHTWAVANPEKVGGIYADNPVLNLASWPGDFNKPDQAHAPLWKDVLKVYGFVDDAAARAYDQYPIHTAVKVKEAGVPLLYLANLEDPVVPPKDNAFAAVKNMGGYAQVMRKPGMGHHPHSLPDPRPIIDFALKTNGTYINPAAHPAPSAEFRGGPAGWGGGTWWDQHHKINKVASENPGLELIFLGDSISQSWTGPHQRVAQPAGTRAFDRHFGKHWKAASFGISGERTEHLLYRTWNGNFDGLKPKVVVVMIGVNNIVSAGHTAEQVAGGIVAVVDALRQKLPDTRVLLLGPFPSGWEKDNPRRQIIRDVHALIAPLGDRTGITYANLTSHFVHADGSLNKQAYAGDAVHLQQGGYTIWAEALLPQLESLLQP